MPPNVPLGRIEAVVDVDSFRRWHDEVAEVCDDLRTSARRLPDLAPTERLLERQRLLDRLEPLEAHMQLDERLLYREVCTRLRDPLATSSMSYDHRAIREWLRRLPRAPVEGPDALQDLLYGSRR